MLLGLTLRQFEAQTGYFAVRTVSGKVHPHSEILSTGASMVELRREKALLEMVSRNVALPEVLDQLVRSVEAASHDGMLASVLLLDDSGTRLLFGAAPSLPAAYNQAIHGLEIGPAVGSCGTAAATGRPVFVEDIARDPLWANFKTLTAEHGLAACSSLPILGAEGEVLGTLAMYYRVPRLPSETDRALIDSALYLAGIAISRDRADRQLRRNEEEFRTLANAIPQLAWMAGPDGHIFWYNERWFEYTGTHPEQMQGWGWQSVHDPELLPAVVERWRTSLETGQPFEMEFPLRGADGVFRTFLTRVEPIRDEAGHVLRWFGTNTNIDEQRRAAERNRTLVEASSQAIWSADADGLITTGSPSWSELTGQTAEEMSGRGWLDALYPADRDRVLATWNEAIRTGQQFAEQFRVWSTQNRFLSIRAKGVPVLAKDGRVLEWLVANTDVTEQVEAEQQLRQRARYSAFRSTLNEELHLAGPAENILTRCCVAMVDRLGFHSSQIWRAGSDGEFELVAAHGSRPPDAGATIAQIAASDRGHLNNALDRGLDPAWSEWIRQERYQALAGHAIRSQGTLWGILVGMARELLPVDICHELGEAADSIGARLRRGSAELEQAALLERERSARREAETLLALAESLARATNLDEAVAAVAELGTALLGAAFGACFYEATDEAGEPVTVSSLSGVSQEGFSRLGLVEGEPPGRSHLAVPIQSSRGEDMGRLVFGHPQPGRFSEHHAPLAERLSVLAALAFERRSLSRTGSLRR